MDGEHMTSSSATSDTTTINEMTTVSLSQAAQVITPQTNINFIQ